MNGAPFHHRPCLRLVPPPRPRRLSVRISVADGRSPICRTRILRLSDRDLEQLINAAPRLEARR
jgi:hypothetical protein